MTPDERYELEEKSVSHWLSELKLSRFQRGFWTDGELEADLNKASLAKIVLPEQADAPEGPDIEEISTPKTVSMSAILKIREERLIQPLRLRKVRGGHFRAWRPDDMLWIHLAYDLARHGNLAVPHAAWILKEIYFEDMKVILERGAFKLLATADVTRRGDPEGQVANLSAGERTKIDAHLKSSAPALRIINRCYLFLRGTGEQSAIKPEFVRRLFAGPGGAFSPGKEFWPSEFEPDDPVLRQEKEEAEQAEAAPVSVFEFDLVHSLTGFIQRLLPQPDQRSTT